MPLIDTRVRNVKPQAKAYKLSDGGGMYLLVSLQMADVTGGSTIVLLGSVARSLLAFIRS
jgi:hypothetical protein